MPRKMRGTMCNAKLAHCNMVTQLEDSLEALGTKLDSSDVTAAVPSPRGHQGPTACA